MEQEKYFQGSEYFFRDLTRSMHVLTLSLPSTSKTNTSVPSMFQGLLNIDVIWYNTEYLQNHSTYCFETFTEGCFDKNLSFELIIINSHVTVGCHFGSHIENMKNAYKQLFYAKKIKHPSTPSIKHKDLF